jgi:glycosyltransferase involved in cell wall biosynthesis
MKVSVIVPCYNNELYLRRCLTALFTQTYPRDKYEVILIDNNSTDHSVEIARAFPDSTILREEIKSPYAARNSGIRQATGEVLAFTDSDCEVCSEWIETMAASLAEPNVALVLGSNRNATESFSLALLADYEAQKAEFICTQEDQRLYYGYTNNMAVRREVFLRYGPFMQIDRGADTIFVGKVVEALGTESVQHVNKAEIRHLEIARVLDWYQKIGIYGRSYQSYRLCSRRRALGFNERIKILRQTITSNRYAWPRTLGLAALLAVGVIPFEMGRFQKNVRR